MPAKKTGYSIAQLRRKNGRIDLYLKVSATKDGKPSSLSLGSLGRKSDYASDEEIQKKASGVYEAWLAKTGGNRATVIFDADRDSEYRTVHFGRLYIARFLRDLGIIDKLGNLKGEKRAKYRFDLAGVVETLIESQILCPGSKRHTFLAEPEDGCGFGGGTELQHVYRALDVLAAHCDEINAYSYKRIRKLEKTKANIYYYDCTNFYYTQGSEGTLLGTKKAKEGMVAPLVQMGLLIDEKGYLVGMVIFNGKDSEQQSLEQQISGIAPHISMDKVVVCTDAGLCSFRNKKLLSINGRGYITTQPILGTKVPKLVKDYVTCDTPMDCGMRHQMKVSELKAMYMQASESGNEAEMSRLMSLTLFKDSWFELSVVKRTASREPGKRRRTWAEAPADLTKDDMSDAGKDTEYVIRYEKRKDSVSGDPKGKDRFYSRLLVSFSLKYWFAQTEELKRKRERIKELASSKARLDGIPKELRGFAKTDSVTKDGEIAEVQIVSADEDAFREADRFAGYYVQATNLGGDAEELYEASRMRWQIEYCFRTMKTNIDARPIYLTTEAHIKGHFTVVFLALQTLRYMMHRLYDAEGNKGCVLGRARDSIVTVESVMEELRRMKGIVLTAEEGFEFAVGTRKSRMNMLMAKAFGKSMTKQCLRIDDLEAYSGLRLAFAKTIADGKR